jgi:hypothetical protein
MSRSSSSRTWASVKGRFAGSRRLPRFTARSRSPEWLRPCLASPVQPSTPPDLRVSRHAPTRRLRKRRLRRVLTEHIRTCMLVEHGKGPCVARVVPRGSQGLPGRCAPEGRLPVAATAAFFVARFAEAVYVLHAFEKKAQKTPKRDLELGQRRYRELIEARRKERHGKG